MNKVIEAIYSNGLLKPLEALELDEQQRVRLTIEPMDGKEARPTAPIATDADRSAALQRLFALMDATRLVPTRRLPSRDELHC